MENNYDPEACINNDGFDYPTKLNKKDYEDLTIVYVFVSIIVLTTFLFVIYDNDDVKNLRDFCLSNL